MPALTVINNTYTANTPEGVRQCLGFVIHKARLQENQARAFRAHPISIAYGHGSIGSDYSELIMVGDFLDIIPAQGDRVRRRRWWQASRDASSQRLLPFAAYDRARLTRIQQYDNATEIIVQFGQGSHTRLNLTAPALTVPAPGPYTVRAIRIHNVDGSETVPPVRPTAGGLGREIGWNGEVVQASPCPRVSANNQVRAMPPALPQVRDECTRRGPVAREHRVRESIPISELRPREAREVEAALDYGLHSFCDYQARNDT